MSLHLDYSDVKRHYHERGFGKRIGFGERPAVLVVDFTRGLTEKALGGYDFDAPVETTARILERARALDLPIVFTTVAYQDNLKDAGIWGLKMPKGKKDLLGAETVDIDPRLRRRPDESLVVKKYASAFFGTDLASQFVSAGVDTMVIAGCVTSGCVRCTTVDAIQLGFRPMLVEDAVGDRHSAAHAASLVDMEAKYADVVTSNEVLKYFDQLDKTRP